MRERKKFMLIYILFSKENEKQNHSSRIIDKFTHSLYVWCMTWPGSRYRYTTMAWSMCYVFTHVLTMINNAAQLNSRKAPYSYRLLILVIFLKIFNFNHALIQTVDSGTKLFIGAKTLKYSVLWSHKSCDLTHILYLVFLADKVNF